MPKWCGTYLPGGEGALSRISFQTSGDVAYIYYMRASHWLDTAWRCGLRVFRRKTHYTKSNETSAAC